MITATVIEGFVRSCLVKGFDGSLPTPDFHRELWGLFCSKDKYIAVAAPRSHAKSTAGTISYGLANILFRERKHILIVSNTEEQASAFLQEMRAILVDNEYVKEAFGLALDAKGETSFEVDSVTELVGVFADGTKFRVLAKGSGQRLRGMLWRGTRPDLIICDDLEDDEICMNKDRRKKFRDWFMNALLPAKSGGGIVRVVGTILHMDSLLERLMPVETSKNTIVTDLKVSSTSRCAGQWVSVKYRAHNKDLSKILWPEKFSKQELTELREAYVAQGNAAGYSQEYLNVPIDESAAHFKRDDFRPIRKEDLDKQKNYYITADLAISEKERADYSAFVVGGVDENNVLHIVHTVKGRFDGRQIVEMILQLQNRYQPLAFGIEDMQVSKSIGPFLREAMQEQGIFPNVIPLKPHRTDKITRSYSIQARMRTGAVRFDKEADWYQELEDEMCQFPRSRNDDLVDAMSYLGLMLDMFVQGMSKKEIEQEEYEEELEDSYFDSGKSETCGY
jgi:predicted phage terminase large subunit-like protein